MRSAGGVRKERRLMKKKFVSLLVAGVMVSAMLAGCGSSKAASKAESAAAEAKSEVEEAVSEAEEAAEEAVSEAEETAEEAVSEAEEVVEAATEEASAEEAPEADASYSFAINTFGAGAYPLDEIVVHEERLAGFTGVSLDKVDNQFTADVVVSQLDGQLANQPDAVVAQLMAATTFAPVIEKCIDAGVVLAFDSNFPAEAEEEICRNYENFAGGFSSNPYDMGVQMAEIAWEDGNKSAIILGAAVGDYSHDNRQLGFTDKFEELGGEVLQVQHCSDPSEAVTKGNDLLTAQPDADCIYCSGGDYVAGACSIKTQKGLDIKIYGTDVNPEYFDETAEGIINGVNGGQGVCGSLAMCLAINLLDGHKIVDADGNVPLFDNLQVFVTTPENAEQFTDLYADGTKLITDEEYQNLLWRYNPDVTIDTYNEFLEHYGDNVCARIAE